MCSTRWGTYYGSPRCWGGLSRHPRWPPFWAPSWILPKIWNCQKTLKIGNVWRSTCRIWQKYVAAFCWHFWHFSPKKGKNSIFLQKWLDHLLLMTSYLVTIATDAHQTCVKMCLRDMRTATEYGRSRYHIISHHTTSCIISSWSSCQTCHEDTPCSPRVRGNIRHPTPRVHLTCWTC